MDKETMMILLCVVFAVWFIVQAIVEVQLDLHESKKQKREYEALKRRLAIRRRHDNA